MPVGRLVAGQTLSQLLMAFKTEFRSGRFQISSAHQAVGAMAVFTASAFKWLMNHSGCKPCNHFAVAVKTVFTHMSTFPDCTGNQEQEKDNSG